MSTENSPYPDFAGFAQALRNEAEWMLSIHRHDDTRGGTGQARGDAEALRRLASRVEDLGRKLNLWDEAPQG